MALPAPTPESTVVVTGASSGIGAELARELARRGYGVTLVARRTDRLEALAKELPTTTAVISCDLTDRAAREELVRRLDDPNVVGLCNNAGHGLHGPFHEADLDRELGMVTLNVEALHHLTGALLPRLVRQGAGAILNVASTAAFQPLPGFATYAATKAFVQSFSEAVHAELGGTGVSVTCLCPGFTHTEFGENAGTREAEEALPGFLWMEAPEVARTGVDAMVAGRRSAIPGLLNRASMIGGRMTPRTVLLPLVRQVNRRR